MTTEANGAPTEVAPSIAAPAAPAAAPVTPVVAAPEPEPAKPAPTVPNLNPPAEETPVITYDPTGDPALDVALEFVGRFGIDADNPAMVAAQKGDFSILEAILAANPNAKGYEKHIELGKQALARQQTAATEVATQVQAAVYDVAGGQEQWNAVQEWARANADPAERDALNAMFAAGPVQARAAAMLLTNLYGQAKGTVIEPASAASQNSSRPATAGTPLTNKEYAREVAQLHRRLGGKLEGSPEYAALNARLAVSSR